MAGCYARIFPWDRLRLDGSHGHCVCPKWVRSHAGLYYISLIYILVGNLEDFTDWNFIYLVERARMITMIYLIITPVMKNFFFSISYHANNLKTVNYTASRLRNKKLYSA